MPDLQTACDALTAWAREQCEACKQQRLIDAVGFFFVGRAKCREVNDYHTCHKYIERARDVGIATLYERHSQEYGIVAAGQFVEGDPDILTVAELERLLGETANG